MWKEVFLFYWMLYQQYTWQPTWLDCRNPEQTHFHRRRFTPKYRRKKRIVRSLWYGLSGLMLLFPYPPFAVFASLFGTFLSFCILDETP